MRRFGKKIFQYGFFFVVMFFIITSGSIAHAQTIPFEGDGTKASPYLIQDADDLVTLSVLVNSGTSFSNQYLKMTSNIDLSGLSFTPIGTSSHPFSGQFDGCGYQITNLSIQSTALYCGLFGYVEYYGALYRMDVSGSVTSTYSGSDTVAIGLVAGYARGKIYGVKANGVLTGPAGSKVYIGMVVGEGHSCRIRSAHTSGRIHMTIRTSSNVYYAGGIMGYSDYGHVQNSDSAVQFVSDTDYAPGIVGGIIGFVESNTEVESCTLLENIELNQTAWKLGGIVGELGSSGTVKNCLVEKTITLTQTKSTNYVGGIVGYDYGYVDSCVFKGHVTADVQHNTCIGGIVGQTGSSASSVSGCVFAGWVDAFKETGESPSAGPIYGLLSLGGAGSNVARSNGVFVNEDLQTYATTCWYSVYDLEYIWSNLSQWLDMTNVWGMETAGSPYLRNNILASSVEILNGNEFTILKGENVQLQGYVWMPDATEKCKYSSLKSSIATVDEDTGLVTGIAAGTTYIKVVTDGAGAVETTATITVIDNGCTVMAGHKLTKIEATTATTTEAGNIEYYVCENCQKYFEDAEGKNEIAKEDTVIPAQRTDDRSETEEDNEALPEEGTEEKGEALPEEVGTEVRDITTGFRYMVTSVNGEEATVEYSVQSKSLKGSVTIPPTIMVDDVTYKVTSIAKNAFKKNTQITKVMIGSNVTTIGKEAFYGCTKLKTVKIGNNVTTIGDKAFYKCTKLTAITIPSKVRKIGKSAFEGCKSLKNVTIKTTLLKSAKVGKNAFKGMKAKATIKVPKNKYKAYKTMLQKKGINKKAKFKKL